MMVHEKPVIVSPCGQFIKTTAELGKGSQRVVYKGNDLRNGRCVAWCEPKSREKSEWEKFTKTSTLLENIHHKNIIRFLDFWDASPSTSRTPVLITELMSCTLRQHLETSPRGFDHTALRSWAHQVLDAIRYLHFNSHHVIVHRSIRCDHVFINTHKGDAKLCSFGSATLMERGKHLEEMVGEPAYMSPEMVCERYNEAHDIYSYGLFLMEIATLEYPYEECEKLSQTLQYLKSEKYPKALENIQCAYTSDLIRGCLEHNLEKRLTIDQISAHPFFQSPLPTGWPKIVFHSFEGDMVTIAISFTENHEVQLYSINMNTDHSRYVAASLVRGEYIKEAHLQDASVQLHKIIEKVKRQTRIKNELMQDYFPMAQPITVNNNKATKTPKGVALTLCSFDADEHQVELELSQTRIGKVVKFQFGVMDHEAEEIAENLVKQGHLITENKVEFLAQLDNIVKEQRDLARVQEQDNEEIEMDGTKEDTTMEQTESVPDLNLEIKRKLSRENSQANNVMSPDIDTRSILSESSSRELPETFNSANSKSISNGVESMISPPIMTSRGISVAPPNYYRPTTSLPPNQPNVMFYPQYMMMPGTQLHPGQMPPSNYVMMPAGHMPAGHMPAGHIPAGHMPAGHMSNSIYTNGHMTQWSTGPPHGTPMSHGPSEMSPIRIPASHLPYIPDRGARSEQDTPPPGYIPDMDGRPDT